MGQFSCITSDTDEQVFCEPPKDTYYLLIPEEFQNEFGGKKYFKETNYDGYGRFEGKDAYALVAQCNKPDECKNPDGSWKDDDEIRGIGIGIACYDQDNFQLKYPIKITAQPMDYRKAEPSRSDDNQGWHVECLICDWCGNAITETCAYDEGDYCPDCGRGRLEWGES